MAALHHSDIVGSLFWPTEADTEASAQHLAKALQDLHPAGQALIELRGELGAGKTTFARHLMRALGVKGRIKSPTYAVVETYQIDHPAMNIAHFDFYRFNDSEEWEEAGFREIFAGPGLKLVEWADKARDRMPVPDLVMDIHSQADSDNVALRQVKLICHGPTGKTLAQALT